MGRYKKGRKPSKSDGNAQERPFPALSSAPPRQSRSDLVAEEIPSEDTPNDSNKLAEDQQSQDQLVQSMEQLKADSIQEKDQNQLPGQSSQSPLTAHTLLGKALSPLPLESVTIGANQGLATSQPVPQVSQPTNSIPKPQVSEDELQELLANMSLVLPLVKEADLETIDTYAHLFLADFDVSKVKQILVMRYTLLQTSFKQAIKDRRLMLNNEQGSSKAALQKQQPAKPTFAPTQPSTAMEIDGETSQVPKRRQDKKVGGLEERPVLYRNLSNYQSDLQSRVIMRDQGLLAKAALAQVEQFSKTFSIVKPAIYAKSLRDTFLFKQPLTRFSLTRDQIVFLQAAIKPTESRSVRVLEPDSIQMRLPFFNPDFQLPCTIMLIKSTPSPFVGFEKIHVRSAIDLPTNKNKSLNSLEAAFAYDQGVRWILLQLDSAMNSFFNECFGFYLANGIFPRDAIQGKDYGRCTGFRCGHTMASDGQHWLFFCKEKETLQIVYTRLLSSVSPVLLFGNSCIVLVAPCEQLPKSLDHLPPPPRYEHLMPVMNMWATLTKNFLEKQFVEKFSPCLFVGGCYLPMFSSEQHAVHGKLIVSMPTFAHFCESKYNFDTDAHYRWDPLLGKWDKVESSVVPNLKLFAEYMHKQPANTPPRTFGSWHFHTCWNRPNSLRVATQASSWAGQVNQGQSIVKPLFGDDIFIHNVVLSFCHRQSPAVRQSEFLALLDRECSYRIEWALRYRHLDNILYGKNAPYISWKLIGHGNIFDCKIFTQQPFGLYEAFHFSQGSFISYFNDVKQMDKMTLLPKQLATNFYPPEDRLLPHVQVCTRRLFNDQKTPTQDIEPTPHTVRVHERRVAAQLRQESSQPTKKRNTFQTK